MAEQRLTPRELRFLGLIYPQGSIAAGLSVGNRLHRLGYLTVGRNGRFTISPKGMIAVVASRRKAPKATAAAV
jgi:hypothetical protein